MSDITCKNASSFNAELRSDIVEICRPLEKYFGITLSYYRRFFSGKLLYLSPHRKWAEYVFTRRCWCSPTFAKRIQYLYRRNTLYYLWPDMPPQDDPVYCALYNFGIWNGVEIYKKNLDCIESYAFASIKDKGEDVKNIYRFEKDILEQFICYFKSKLLPLIASAENKNDILIPYELEKIRGPAHREKRELFFADTAVQYFYLRTNGEDVKLTKRQEECLALFALGKKMKEIGSALNLSEKTIEFYLRKIMKKTQLDTKSKLLRSYVENRNITI